MHIDFKPYSLNIKEKLFTINEPKVMGILNTTSDSFYDGGKHDSIERALRQVEIMLEEGADLIDVGGESSRPGAETIGVEEELSRTIPFIEAIIKRFPETVLSIDTYKARVAENAVLAGASIINDISAGEADSLMLDIVARLKVPYIAMHKKGEPKTMQLNPEYTNVTTEVLKYFADKKRLFSDKGIYDLIIDVGFGFGKSMVHNYALLKNLAVFHTLDLPVLVGISRKGMIWKNLGTNPEGALAGTIAANTIALLQGVHILRVHDVKQAKDAIRICAML
jgi:dihydropteroate synthase